MTLALLFAAGRPPDLVGDRSHCGAQVDDDVAARDRALAVAVRSEDDVVARAALSRLLYAYTSSLTRFARGLVGSADIADDVVQDVFVRVWASRGSIDPSQSLRAYLFTSVRRASLDVLKRRAVETRYAERLGTEGASVEVPPVDGRLDADAVARAVRDVVARLPERRRTALRLRYEEELPFADVARVMGVSEKAAKHLVTRAVDEVRAALGL